MKRAFAFAFAILLLFTHIAIADSSDIRSRLIESEEYMSRMLEDGISVTLYNDTLGRAWSIFNYQLSVEKGGMTPNYTKVEEALEELQSIREKAYRVMDELSALMLYINKTEGINKSVVWEMFREAEEEFKSERYDEALDKIDESYSKIAEMEALEAKIAAFYDSLSRTFWGFVSENWIQIITAILLIALAVILLYNRIMCRIIEMKIASLTHKKESIKKLIMKEQREYFEHGKIGEDTYKIRIKKYGEMIRDINRAIPLLTEELTLRRKKRFI